MAVTFTGRSLILQSSRLIGALQQGEVLDAPEMQDALNLLNGLLDGLSTRRTMLSARTREAFAFVSNQTTYTMGPSGDWVTTRPSQIDSITAENYTASPTFEVQMTQMTYQAYQAWSIKSESASYPFYFYWNGTFPNATVYCWPAPTDTSNYRPIVYSPTALAEISNLSTSYTLPPGYYRMLYYTLAEDLGPAFALPVDGEIHRLAAAARIDATRLNLQMDDLGTPELASAGGIYNIYFDGNY